MEELTPVRCGCGGEAKVYHWNHDPDIEDWYGVQCSECHINISMDKNRRPFWSAKEAIQAWNSAMGSTEKSSTVERTAKVKEDEWTEHKMLSRDYGKIYYQHDCSCNLYESPYPFCPNCGMKMKRGDR